MASISTPTPGIIMPTEPVSVMPIVRKVTSADLVDALRKGLSDFWAMPTHVVFLCLIYPVIGLVLGRMLLGLDLLPLLYPVVTGFALVGPFAAIGTYELSRRRELGMDTSWWHAFDVVRSPSFPAVLLVGLLLMLTFAAWVMTADAIYLAHFGKHEPLTSRELVSRVMTTSAGHSLIVIGNLVGLLYAVLVLSLAVVTFPLLLDRHVSAWVALATSVQVVLANPLTMTLWGLIIAGSLLLGALPFLLGLAVALPVLGHASWHLYRKAVAPDPGPRPDPQPTRKGVRYAADFPSSLFSTYHGDDR